MDQPTIAPRAHTIPLQALANRMVRGLLRTPLLCRVVGARLITLYLVGRKTGRHYTLPVAYTRCDGYLLVGTAFGWGRNLRTGQPVNVRLKGALRRADVQVISDEAGVVADYATMARDNHQFAKLNGIRLDATGTPSPDDLHLAWRGGARAFRLTVSPAGNPRTSVE
jgi:deazaflavin-dependent oxidoreductase (nitroreductase family)